jgi:hypothetical protein
MRDEFVIHGGIKPPGRKFLREVNGDDRTEVLEFEGVDGMVHFHAGGNGFGQSPQAQQERADLGVVRLEIRALGLKQARGVVAVVGPEALVLVRTARAEDDFADVVKESEEEGFLAGFHGKLLEFSEALGADGGAKAVAPDRLEEIGARGALAEFENLDAEHERADDFKAD